MIENKSSPPYTPIRLVNDETADIIIMTGSPFCFHADGKLKHKCSNRSVPGHIYCGPHGGKLVLRSDGTLGIIGPGAYRAIAQLAGLNNRYVSQVLQGKANPTSNVLDKIARVVGISVERLVRYIEEQKREWSISTTSTSEEAE